MMRLGEWLEEMDVKPHQFAVKIGRSPEAVRRYVTGERIPDKDTMPLIVRETAGKVWPNDFYDLDGAADASSSQLEAAR